jgi:hypothetical protein
LLLTTGELRGQPVPVLAEVDEIEGLTDSAADLGLADLALLERERDLWGNSA